MFQLTGPLSYVLDRIAELRAEHEEERGAESERETWMEMHEQIIFDGGSLDSD